MTQAANWPKAPRSAIASTGAETAVSGSGPARIDMIIFAPEADGWGFKPGARVL